ncbi:8396_t:CDS:2, partial [Scutellospora calospora]
MSLMDKKSEFEDIYDCNICFDYTEKIFPIPNCRCSTPSENINNQATPSSSSTKPIITNLKRKRDKGKSRDNSSLNDFHSITDSFFTRNSNFFSDDFYSSLSDSLFTRKKTKNDDSNDDSLEYEKINSNQ